MTRKAAVTICLALVLGGGLPASAEGGTDLHFDLDREVYQAGQTIRLTGEMTVTEQPVVKTLWTDGTLASDLPAFQYPLSPIADLVEGSIERSRPGEPLTMRIKVAPALGAEPGPTPFQWYRWPFHLGDRWYFVEFTYTQVGTGFEWQGTWYYCRLALGSSCVHGTTPSFPLTWEPASRTLTGRIPIRDLGIVQGDGILPQDTMRPFDPQYPAQSGNKYPAATLGQDRAPAFEPVLLPVETIYIGIARRGTAEQDVQWTQKAQPSPTQGSLQVPFNALIETETLEIGDYEMWVKGCFGPCTVERLPFTVT